MRWLSYSDNLLRKLSLTLYCRWHDNITFITLSLEEDNTTNDKAGKYQIPPHFMTFLFFDIVHFSVWVFMVLTRMCKLQKYIYLSVSGLLNALHASYCAACALCLQTITLDMLCWCTSCICMSENAHGAYTVLQEGCMDALCVSTNVLLLMHHNDLSLHSYWHQKHTMDVCKGICRSCTI